MIDYQIRSLGRLNQRESRRRLHNSDLNKLDAIAARAYTDDADVRMGALSAPHNHGRPGMRDDDGIICSFGGTIAYN